MAYVYDNRYIIHVAATILTFIAAIFTLLAFSTPYWLISRGSVNTDFEKLGLWETCFNGYGDPTFQHDQSFQGCRWVFDEDYSIISDQLLPRFFIAVQIFYTFGFTILLLACGLLIALLLCLEPNKRANTLIVISIILFASFICCLIAVITFGALGDGRDWMPDPDHNYLSWSYGLAVVGTFLELITAILFIVEARIVQYRRSKEVEQQQNVFTLTSHDSQYHKTTKA